MFAAGSAALLGGAAIGLATDGASGSSTCSARVLNVPFLALGTVYLLGGDRVGRPASPSAVGLVAAFAAGVVVVAPLTRPVAGRPVAQARTEVFGVLPAGPGRRWARGRRPR